MIAAIATSNYRKWRMELNKKMHVDHMHGKVWRLVTREVQLLRGTENMAKH